VIFTAFQNTGKISFEEERREGRGEEATARLQAGTAKKW
jgi:hypothetical protein